MNRAIHFENISAGYGGDTILKNLTLSIEEGEMLAVLGPNGAGKTTLLRLITGLLRPAQGSVRLFGDPADRIPAPRRARLVGVVPQSLEIPVAFTVAEIVMMGRTALLGRWGRPLAEDRRCVERAMVFTDVVDMKHRPFTDLSGGERQRVVIAMVLAQEPRLILLDEATSHLDLNHRLEVMQIVERLNRERGVTVLAVSHDLNLSAEFCQRLILLDHGTIAADGLPAHVLTEDNLKRVYHCDVRILQNTANGSVTVVPAPRMTPRACGRGTRVHVVAGGGSGEEILRRLALCEYAVTAGVLNQGDSDAEVADALGITVALEKPFSAIGTAALAQARGMATHSDVVIVAGVPFGPGNVVNLDIAEHALKEGKKVFVMDGIPDRDYTPSHEAAARSKRIATCGAVSWRTITDLFGQLPQSKPPA